MTVGLPDHNNFLQLDNIWLFGVLSCSLWQWVHGSVGEAIDAFESALGAVMQLNVLQKLWMEWVKSYNVLHQLLNMHLFHLLTQYRHKDSTIVPWDEGATSDEGQARSNAPSSDEKQAHVQ